MASDILILLAHGSRSSRWSESFETLAGAVGQRVGPDRVATAYLQFGSPSLDRCVRDAAGRGVKTIRVLPMLWASGGHMEGDIAPMVARLDRESGATVKLLAPLGEHEAFVEWLASYAADRIDGP